MPPEGRFAAAGTISRTGTLSDTLSHKSVVDKQRAAIDKLRAQNARLKEELLLENKFSVRPSNPGATVLINKLQDEADLYTRKIQLEKRKVLMLQQQLDQMQNTLGTTRNNMGGIFNAKEKSQALQKQIKLLENRLEKQYIKYNEAITYNKALREQIDNLRRERMMFEAINNNLDKELARIKRNIADTISAANVAHTAKEKALAEMAALKLQAEKDHAAFEEEWRQLTHIIEEDRRQREAARAQEMAEREQRTQELLKSCDVSAASKKAATRATWGISIQKVLAQNVSQEKVRLYGEAFAKIQEATGIQEIDELVHAFVDGEDANFKLFNYVNEVNSEVEKLEDTIGTVRQDIEAYTAKAAAAEAQSTAATSGVLNKLSNNEGRAAAYKRRLQHAMSLVEGLKSGIDQMFEGIGCNTAPVKALLGGAELTEDNMLSYLGIVEQRANELLQAYALSKASHGAGLSEMLLAQPLPPPQVRIIVDPPSTWEHSPRVAANTVPTSSNGMLGTSNFLGGPGGTEEDGEESDNFPDDVPLTRALLQAKVSKNLDAIIERSLKIKPVGGPAGNRGKSKASAAAAAAAMG